jgi:glycosyltransferase involved in cell wall biosynthesis
MAYQFLQKCGHTPQLIYLAYETAPHHSWRKLIKHFLTTPPVFKTIKEGMVSLGVVDYPVPTRFKYHLLRLAHGAIKNPISLVVSGSSHPGLPLALAKRPYLLWVATLYEDEIMARSLAGDQWATNLLHHADWKELNAQEQLVYENATLILGLSPNTTARIAQKFPQVQTKLQTMLYPIDTDQFCPKEATASSPYLLCTARTRDPRKNVRMLLQAFAKVRIKYPHLRLVITTDAPLDSTKEFIQQLKIQDAVEFSGSVTQDKLIELYQNATLFVFPSLQEGLGISILDAFACGLPVISTRSGGPEGIIQHGLNGILTPHNDASAFAQAILNLLDNPSYAQTLGKEARQTALQNFSTPLIKTKFREALHTVYPQYF